MSDEMAIRTEGLGRRYGTRWVVDGLDLAVPRGSVFGLLGLNGAGKSTTIRMLMGLIRRHSGEAHVLGLDPARQDVEIKRRVGYVAEAPAFYEWMTVEEVCAFVAHYRRDRWNDKTALDLLKRFRVPLTTRLKDLSKGQRAKTALTLALSFDPELLILDEPTSGLDPLARREFVEGVLAEFQELGRTVFLSSHLVNELAGLVDHIGIMHEGRLLLSEPVEDFIQSIRRVRLTFDGEVPAKIEVPGMLRCKANGREALVSVRNFDEDITVGQLKAFRPTSVQVEPLNLEDAFVEYISGAERGAV